MEEKKKQKGFNASATFTVKDIETAPGFQAMMDEMDNVNDLAQAISAAIQANPLARTDDGKYLLMKRVYEALAVLTANFIVRGSNPDYVEEVANRYVNDLREQIQFIRKQGNDTEEKL